MVKFLERNVNTELDKDRVAKAIYDNVVEPLRTRLETCEAALRLIAAPMRPDGTYNRDRRACQLIAEDALRGDARQLKVSSEPLAKII